VLALVAEEMAVGSLSVRRLDKETLERLRLVAEISYGLNCLVDGQRKRMLADRFEETAVDLVNPWTAR
jgi:hypothetical protein